MKKLLLFIILILCLALSSSADVGTSRKGVSGGGGAAAPTITCQTHTAAQIASSTDLTVNTPSGTADGDILVLTFNDDTNQALTTTGWTQVQEIAASSSRHTVAYKVASSEGASYTFTTTGASEKEGIIVRYSKSSGTWSVPTSSEKMVESTASLTSNSVDVISGDMLILSASTDDLETLNTAPSDMTLVHRESAASSLSAQYYQGITTNDSITKTEVYATNIDHSLIAVVLRLI